MIDNSLSNLINEQVNFELQSSNLYMQFAGIAAIYNYDNIEKFFLNKSKEEYDHAIMIFNFLSDINEGIYIESIPSSTDIFAKINLDGTAGETLQVIFEESLLHEKQVTGRINSIVFLSKQTSEFKVEEFFFKLIQEQVEEEKEFEVMLDEIKRIRKFDPDIYNFNKQILDEKVDNYNIKKENKRIKL